MRDACKRESLGIDSKQWKVEVGRMLADGVAALRLFFEIDDKLQDEESRKAIGFMGGKDLIVALGIHPTRANAFEQQLSRKRNGLGDRSWIENIESGPNEPKYLYRADSQATSVLLLVDAAKVELFYTPGAGPEGYASMSIKGHRETMRVGSKLFKSWLSQQYWMKHKGALAE